MYLVVFRYRKHEDIDVETFLADARRMEKLARAQPGFISFKTFRSDDGEIVAMSEWASEAAVLAWASHPEHEAIRKRGRESYYRDYTLYACAEPRVHRHHRRQD